MRKRKSFTTLPVLTYFMPSIYSPSEVIVIPGKPALTATLAVFAPPVKEALSPFIVRVYMATCSIPKCFTVSNIERSWSTNAPGFLSSAPDEEESFLLSVQAASEKQITAASIKLNIFFILYPHFIRNFYRKQPLQTQRGS